MQCTEAGVVIALRRRVERMRILHEKKESCLTFASITAPLVVTKKVCCRSCVSSVGTVQLVVWEPQLLTGRERQICEFISDSIHQESGIQENSGEIRQRTIIVELDRTCDEQLDGCRVGDDDVSRRGSSSKWPCRGRCS